MAIQGDKYGTRHEFDQIWAGLALLTVVLLFSVSTQPTLANGTTAGRLRTSASASYRIGQLSYTLGSTDDAWNLSAETNTTASQYRAYWLLVNSSGARSIAAGSNAATAELALRRLPELDGTKAVFGVYVAGPSTDFGGAGGLAAQGTIHTGVPAGANVGSGIAAQSLGLVDLRDR